MKYISAPIKLLILLSVLAFGLVSQSAQAQPKDIEFKSLNGKIVKLSDYRGKWVIVNYWATWCPPCRVEMPELSLFYEEHKNKDAIVLGVNYENKTAAQLKPFLESQMIEFPIVQELNGANGSSTSFGPLKGLPTTYMVAPDGKVVASRTGMVDQKLLESFIKKYNKMMAK